MILFNDFVLWFNLCKYEQKCVTSLSCHVSNYKIYSDRAFVCEIALCLELSDDGGHDVIDNFEFPCNSMENLILIWNFTNTVINNVK